MEGTGLEEELRERLLIQGDTFSINRDKELTEQVNQRVVREIRDKSSSDLLFSPVNRASGVKTGRRKKAKISNYSYFLQEMEANKYPLEMLPEHTRLKTIKKLVMKMLRLSFQWQQQFNKAAEDVMIVMTKDLKSIDMRQQSMEERVENRLMTVLERQEAELQELRNTVKTLTEKQDALSEELKQYRIKDTDGGKGGE